MTPKADHGGGEEAGLKGVELPTSSVADQAIKTAAGPGASPATSGYTPSRPTGGKHLLAEGQCLTAKTARDQRQGRGRQGPEDGPASAESAPATSG